jgi:hypothetical protein
MCDEKCARSSILFSGSLEALIYTNIAAAARSQIVKTMRRQGKRVGVVLGAHEATHPGF